MNVMNTCDLIDDVHFLEKMAFEKKIANED